MQSELITSKQRALAIRVSALKCASDYNQLVMKGIKRMNIYSDRRLKTWKYRGNDGKFYWYDKKHFTCRLTILTGKVKLFNNH